MTPGNDDTISSAVGLTDVPEPVRVLGGFTRPDYVDCFTITTSTAADGSAEEWGRAALENTPIGRSAPALWRSLGLRLGPTPARDHVQGWKIAGRGADWLRLETSSWFMTAHAVVRVDDRHVAFALFLRYDHPVAPAIWRPVSILHRRALPVMLHQAVTSVRRSHQLVSQDDR